MARKGGGSMSVSNQLAALQAQQLQRQQAMPHSGSGGGEVIDLYPTAIQATPGNIVATPQQQILQQSPQQQIIQPTMPRINPTSNLPIVYANTEVEPTVGLPKIWMPHTFYWNAGKFSPGNPWRLLHSLGACFSSWVYQPMGSFKSVGVILGIGIGGFFTIVGLFAWSTGKSVTVGAPERNVFDSAPVITEYLPTVDVD
ncbi:MAG: hypothetical protein F6K36_26545 [Symploca sp. SIO3C6]|uniref:Uncharacterized protein n=1 Tax=Symploca sp. SIO1C4 TaxID=2607765 RepID=A0A6B3NMT2_9CYAN|nr:hypothetical protein [Symploca sp. SIO3C6]NEO98764.1 hypothetical protein [Symploca sp. SIO2E9]NER30518.1 hypothetical protein [Symploca sp. SIO1C4]